eukprot:1317466-Rhodomonas_salina.2
MTRSLTWASPSAAGMLPVDTRSLPPPSSPRSPSRCECGSVDMERRKRAAAAVWPRVGKVLRGSSVLRRARVGTAQPRTRAQRKPA